MSRGTSPLVCYGSAADLSTWSQQGTCAVASGIADPFGGTGAYSLTDNDGGAFEYRYTTWTESAGGTPLVAVFAKDDNGSGDLGIAIYDQTATTMRHWVTYSFFGNAYTGHLVESGSGTVYTPISVGSNWFLILLGAASCVAGNVHQLQLRPGAGAVGATVTSYFYVRNVVLLDPLDTLKAYREPRDGSEVRQGPSGTEEAWTVGTDYYLSGQMRHIPADVRDFPSLVSGWRGANEAAGINCSVDAMLTQGRDKQTLRFVPDRSAASTYRDSYLVEPMRGEPDYEEGGSLDFTAPLKLRGSSSFAVAL